MLLFFFLHHMLFFCSTGMCNIWRSKWWTYITFLIALLWPDAASHTIYCLAHACVKDADCFIPWILLLTSVEAANSARHGLSEDHAAVTRGGAVFNVKIVIHADLWNVDKQIHTAAQKIITWCFTIYGLDSVLLHKSSVSLSIKTSRLFTLNVSFYSSDSEQKDKELWGGGSDLVYGALCMKSSCVVPRWVFNGGTRMAHVFRGLLTLLGRRTGAGQRRPGEQCEAEARM